MPPDISRRPGRVPHTEDLTIVVPRRRPPGRLARWRWCATGGCGLLAVVLLCAALLGRTPSRVARLPVADEAAIAAEQPQTLTLHRFAANRRVLVLDFPTLLQQGLMFDRIAAFAEKAGLPHDRVLSDAELAAAIAAHGDTIGTYYYGHDYSSATLTRFFAAADLGHVALNADERSLRAILQDQDFFAANSDQAAITLPRLGADATMDAPARRAVLRHELSHGIFFTDPAYAAYVRAFWRDTMDDGSRARFTRFLAAQDYDPAVPDLMANEMQAYLMYTPDSRIVSAQAVGLAPDVWAQLRTRFVLGMPAGWLRDVGGE